MNPKGLHYNVPAENKCLCGGQSVEWKNSSHRCARCKAIEEARRGEENSIGQRLIGEKRRLARIEPVLGPAAVPGASPSERVSLYLEQLRRRKNATQKATPTQTQKGKRHLLFPDLHPVWKDRLCRSEEVGGPLSRAA